MQRTALKMLKKPSFPGRQIDQVFIEGILCALYYLNSPKWYCLFIIG